MVGDFRGKMVMGEVGGGVVISGGGRWLQGLGQDLKFKGQDLR